MIRLIQDRGLEEQIKVDSAGTASYHVGEPADPRSAQAAKKRGINLPSRARQFEAEDFQRFDYVLACDKSNYTELRRLAGSTHEHKLSMLLDFDPSNPKQTSVPDPYYGGERGFETVLDMCQSACEHLLDHIIEEHQITPRDD